MTYDPSTPLPATSEAARTTISPKVVISTILALVVPGLMAGISYASDNQAAVFGIDNPLLGVVIAAVVPGLLVFLGGYTKNDPLRH